MATWMYRASRQFLRGAFWVTGGLESIGQDHVPANGPVIVACNHASHLDPMILGAAFRRGLYFLARKTLFEVPGFGWLIRQNQAFPLDREGDIREALRTFGALLDQNKAVVMFPEGTRSLDGVFGETKPGVGMLAVRNQTPVVPVYIWGSFQSWPRGRSYPSPHHLKCLAGPPIVPSGDTSAKKQDQNRINREVSDAIRSLEKTAWEGESNVPEKLRLEWTRPESEVGT